MKTEDTGDAWETLKVWARIKQDQGNRITPLMLLDKMAALEMEHE